MRPVSRQKLRCGLQALILQNRQMKGDGGWGMANKLRLDRFQDCCKVWFWNQALFVCGRHFFHGVQGKHLRKTLPDKDSKNLEALNIDNYPLKLQKHTISVDKVTTRACTSGKLLESGKCLVAQKSCINDATKLRNNLPNELKNCLTISQIKLQTTKFVKTLSV